MKTKRKSLFSAGNYITFFAFTCFVVTCSLLLFLNTMQLDIADVKRQAPITFGNIVFLSLIFSGIDGLYRRYAVERPVRRILNGTEQIMKGDLSARITPIRHLGHPNEFDAIIVNLNKMAEELSGTETLRTDFVSNVSHELKTPLAVIQNQAALLQAPDLADDKRVEYAQAIAAATRRLSDLISNILKLNKLENQTIQPASKKFNLSEQLCECLLLFEDLWEQKNIDIETDIPDDVLVWGDAELLSLVWNNLFSNAFKFTQAGGRVTVALREAGEQTIVSVTDTGCGISEEVGRHIFEKFYQGDTSHATQGNGLGLALVKRVIDMVGGELAVQSKPGEGSMFTISLQREQA